MWYFLAGTIAFLSAYLATPYVIATAINLEIVTDKKKRKHPAHTHRGIVPRAGGVAIYLGLLISSLIFLRSFPLIVGILIASGLLVILGVLDDYYDLSPYSRFIGNILISSLVVGFGLRIPYISNPFGGIIHLDTMKASFSLFGLHVGITAGDILAVLWLTWTTNMINWSKGVDGQLPGFVGIAALFLGFLALQFTALDITTTTVATFSFIVAGAFFGFLPFNFYPQRIMPGYGGGGVAGFLLGVLAILSFGKLGTALLILSVPMMDAIYTILRRLRNKKSPFRADWGHFHHRLLEIGWGRRRIAVFYWVVTCILGIASLFLKGIEKAVAFVAVAFVLIAFIVIIDQLKKQDIISTAN